MLKCQTRCGWLACRGHHGLARERLPPCSAPDRGAGAAAPRRAMAPGRQRLGGIAPRHAVRAAQRHGGTAAIRSETNEKRARASLVHTRYCEEEPVVIGTPRGFRDILPAEARAREQIRDRVRAVFDERGYVPVETPLLEERSVLEHAGRIKGSPFQLFDSDNRLLMLRPTSPCPSPASRPSAWARPSSRRACATRRRSCASRAPFAASPASSRSWASSSSAGEGERRGRGRLTSGRHAICPRDSQRPHRRRLGAAASGPARGRRCRRGLARGGPRPGARLEPRGAR